MKKSFTLIEILIAAGIFAIAVTLVLISLTSVFKTRFKGEAMKATQETGRQAMETMVNAVKIATGSGTGFDLFAIADVNGPLTTFNDETSSTPCKYRGNRLITSYKISDTEWGTKEYRLYNEIAGSLVGDNTQECPSQRCSIRTYDSRRGTWEKLTPDDINITHLDFLGVFQGAVKRKQRDYVEISFMAKNFPDTAATKPEENDVANFKSTAVPNISSYGSNQRLVIRSGFTPTANVTFPTAFSSTPTVVISRNFDSGGEMEYVSTVSTNGFTIAGWCIERACGGWYWLAVQSDSAFQDQIKTGFQPNNSGIPSNQRVDFTDHFSDDIPDSNINVVITKNFSNIDDQMPAVVNVSKTGFNISGNCAGTCPIANSGFYWIAMYGNLGNKLQSGHGPYSADGYTEFNLTFSSQPDLHVVVSRDGQQDSAQEVGGVFSLTQGAFRYLGDDPGIGNYWIANDSPIDIVMEYQ